MILKILLGVLGVAMVICAIQIARIALKVFQIIGKVVRTEELIQSKQGEKDKPSP